jgi:hypothetical protein
MERKLILSKVEAEEIFLNALCDGLDYISGHGIGICVNNDDYDKAKASLVNPSYEDVLMQILKDGNKLTLIDYEGGDDSWSITLNDVHERMSNVPFDHLINMIQGNYDAITADVILQIIFLNELTFG